MEKKPTCTKGPKIAKIFSAEGFRNPKSLLTTKSPAGRQIGTPREPKQKKQLSDTALGCGRTPKELPRTGARGP